MSGSGSTLAGLGPVLVANRGEIALRVLRGCKELGVPTVAVYSEADRDAPWLRAADTAHLLGPAAPAESYLNVERLLAVAEESGAGAVHPGYGFLSESADFAEAVTAAGLVWIGPPPDAIRRMGDKLSARAAATAAGCPVVPGTFEPTDDPAVVQAFADEHGFPVAIKAAFGGGGRGLKVVRRAEDLQDALDSAQREALQRVRPRRGLRRALPHPPAPRRDPDPGRHPRQGPAPGRARLLRPAPPPEAHRGGPGARPGADRPQGHGRGRRAGQPRGRLRRRRHLRVPLRGRRLLLPGDEHAAAGRAPRHRARHRHRPRPLRSCASPRASRWSPTRTTSRSAATRSRPASTPRTSAPASSPRRAW